jgi:hypothetical protein
MKQNPCSKAIRNKAKTVLRLPGQLRPCGGHSPSQEREEARRAPWKLADGRTRQGTLAGTRQPSHERKAGSGPSGLARGMRSETA